MEVRVYYEDTDINGIVYHANYIKYCDRARLEYFFQNNVPPKEENSYLVIRNLDAKYYRPAFLGDLLIVTNKIEDIRGISVSVYHEVIRKKNMQKVFSMKISLVYIKNEVPSKLPDSFMNLFHRFNDEQKDT